MEQSCAARDRLWASLGTVEPFVLSQASAGGPWNEARWPASRQSFRAIRRSNGTTLLVSDGLSDPFDDVHDGGGNVNGYSLEFYIATPTEELGTTPDEIRESWQFQLLFTVATLAVGHGSIRGILEDMGLLSTEAEGVAEAVPEAAWGEHVNAVGRVGALLGLPDPTGAVPERIPGMPLTDVILVSIKLLQLPELQLISDRGAAGRRRLADLFCQDPDKAVVSSLNRPSVI